MDDIKYLTIEVHSEKKMGHHFLGEATLSQLQTLQPFDEVIDKWWDLQPKYVMKEKAKEKISGRIRVKMYYSMLPETKPSTPHPLESPDIHLLPYFNPLLKTGDLILFDGLGLLSAATKLARNSPFSSIGLVVVLPDKWSNKDETFILEVSRNIDNMRDGFTQQGDTGINLFSLTERLSHYYGSSVWWAPSQKAITPENHKALMEWLSPFMASHKNLKARSLTSVEPALPSSINLLKPHPEVVEFATTHFGVSERWTNFAEAASSDLVVQALCRLGLLNEADHKGSLLYPDQILDLACFGEPYPLRQKSHAFRLDVLPPLLQRKFIETERRLLNAEQRADYERKQADIQATGGAADKLAALGHAAPSGPARDKLLRARESVLTFDMGDRNLLAIMVKGAKLMRFTHDLKWKNLTLSPNEDEISCGHHHIDIQDVDEVRVGLKSTNFDRYRKDLERFEPLAFSIMYGRRRKRSEISKSLDFVANTPLEFKIWTQGLNLVLARRDKPDLAIVQRAYRELKVPQLNLSDTIKLLEKINFKAPTKFVAEKFHEVDVDRSHYLDLNEFLHLLRVLKHRPSVTELFNSVATKSAPGEAQFIDREELLAFLINSQGVRPQSIAENLADAIISKYGASAHGKLDVMEFEEFIISPENEIYDAYEGSVPTSVPVSPMPSDRTLTHYFMASSHNTYLTGNQLTGTSSTEQYITVLRNGCRCVELDCWDGDDGNPIIYHGHTLTSKITFENVCIAINHYAFYSSPYPIVLSIENHCSHNQQIRMGEVMKRVFGERLQLPSDRTKSDVPGALGSPHFLREKILVKGPMNTIVDKKHPKHEIDAQGNAIIALDPSLTENVDDSDDEDEMETVDLLGLIPAVGSPQGTKEASLGASGSEVPASGSSTPAKATSTALTRNQSSALASTAEFLATPESSSVVGSALAQKAKKPKISDALSECITLRTVRFKNFATNSKQQPWEMSSFAELVAAKMAQARLLEAANYNLNHMARIYPKGIRFNSSNYDPYPGFAMGSQMVALNWQTMSPPMYYIEGFFARHGRSGYVLKPPHLRDPELKMATPNLVSELTIRIVDARQLPKKHESQVARPRLEIAVVGCKADCMARMSTKAENGFNPTWNESFTFPISESWSACLVIRLWDRDDEENDVAHYSAMVENLQEGYRIVPLFQMAPNRFPMANILVEVTKKTPSVASASASDLGAPSRAASKAKP